MFFQTPTHLSLQCRLRSEKYLTPWTAVLEQNSKNPCFTFKEIVKQKQPEIKLISKLTLIQFAFVFFVWISIFSLSSIETAFTVLKDVSFSALKSIRFDNRLIYQNINKMDLHIDELNVNNRRFLQCDLDLCPFVWINKILFSSGFNEQCSPFEKKMFMIDTVQFHS